MGKPLVPCRSTRRHRELFRLLLSHRNVSTHSLKIPHSRTFYPLPHHCPYKTPTIPKTDSLKTNLLDTIPPLERPRSWNMLPSPLHLLGNPPTVHLVQLQQVVVAVPHAQLQPELFGYGHVASCRASGLCGIRDHCGACSRNKKRLFGLVTLLSYSGDWPTVGVKSYEPLSGPCKKRGKPTSCDR